MDLTTRVRYNGFILFLIPLIFNIPFASKLPLNHFFPKDPNHVLEILEIIFRILLIICSFTLVMQYKDNPYFKPGILVYFIGVILYFGSWLILIILEITTIDNLNPILRTTLLFAPAYTPLIWLFGMALICNAQRFIGPSILFIFFHVFNFVSIYAK